MLCITTIGYSQTFNTFDNNNNTLQFDITSATTVRIIDYISGGTNLDIPSTVSYNSSTYSVTRIANSSLGGINLTSVILPDGLLSIGNYAFEDNQLTTIIIPNSVTFIGEQAFSNNNLTSVVLSNGLTDIDDFAFEINQLTNITIPSSITDIGFGVFMGNPSLTCVISEATTPPTIVTTGDNLDTFANDRSNINLTVPTGTAAAYATATWINFNSVAEGLTGDFIVDNITYQITSVANNEVSATAYNTAGGTVVNIPDTVTRGCTTFSVVSIGQHAFVSKNLTSVTFTIPSNVTSIGQNGFKANQLPIVNIPNSVTSIGNSAFNNNNLSNITIPNSVVSIGNSAFSVNQLISVSIPNSVTSLGNYTFWNNLIETVIIPSSIVSIGTYVFADNNLTTLTIPSSVTSIGANAFSTNPSLTDVFSESTTPPTITMGTNDTFDSIANRGNIHLHIPGGAAVMDAYVNDAGALWKHFNPVTQDALGISDFELANGITILNITDAIKVMHSNSVSLKNYTICSISGAKVSTGIERNIDTSFLASGIYILKLDFNKGTVIKKFVAN